jgi:hypothetical protein
VDPLLDLLSFVFLPVSSAVFARQLIKFYFCRFVCIVSLTSSISADNGHCDTIPCPVVSLGGGIVIPVSVLLLQIAAMAWSAIHHAMFGSHISKFPILCYVISWDLMGVSNFLLSASSSVFSFK